MSAPDGKMGQRIVEADSEETIRAIVNGLGGRATTSERRFGVHDATIALNDQFYRTVGRLLASMPRLGAYHPA